MASNSKPKITFKYQSSPKPQARSLAVTLHPIPNHANKIKIISSMPPQLKQKYTPKDSGHIRIVDEMGESRQRERRRKIFSQVGQGYLNSQIKERNKSLIVFQGAVSEQARMKHLLKSKQNEVLHTRLPKKADYIQTTSHTKQQPKISTFMIPFINESSYSNKMKMIKLNEDAYSPVQLEQQRPSPLRTTTLGLEERLREKQRQLECLKLQLQRYERCDQIARQNQSIYKRLVNELNLSRGQFQAKHHQQSGVYGGSKKSFQRSPKTLNQSKDQFREQSNYKISTQEYSQQKSSIKKQMLNKQISFGGSKNIDFQAVHHHNKATPFVTFQKNGKHFERSRNTHESRQRDDQNYNIQKLPIFAEMQEVSHGSLLTEMNRKLQRKLNNERKSHYFPSQTTRSNAKASKQHNRHNHYKMNQFSNSYYHHKSNCLSLLY